MYSSPSRFSYRSQNKTKNQKKGRWSWISISVLFLSIFSFYCVLFPEAAGLWGRKLTQFLGWLLGGGRFFVPPVIGYQALLLLIHKDRRLQPLKTLLLSALLLTVLISLSLVGEAVWGQNLGGILGKGGTQLLTRLFGQVGSWIFVFFSVFSLAVLMAGKTPGELFHKTIEILSQDWKEWKQLKTTAPLKEKKTPVVAAHPDLTKPPVKVTAAPKIKGLEDPIQKKEEKAIWDQSPAPEQKKKEPIISKLPAEPKKSVKENGIKEEIQPQKEKTSVPYQAPSLELFENQARVSPVAKEELTNRAKLLEQTLANFSIAATVVEIHPGPVITRYDLEPAPGVKVSSISSRADDLALAMRSTGIRVLAPIPGKGAVGVEIPNSSPERVGLKELLLTPEFLNHKSPLAFILGKTVSGDPCIVDLASMPHILIAGATGSGKSVVVHALISSILYRMPPDRVKFTMIDPKRLELPSYSSIPHIYDPRHSPIQAEVITDSKQAAKALVRLVKVMEHRYDLFAKANVRNIDSYNTKRAAAGLPPEYYLVVIIDELADLMLTSPKEVEDSIQRLAQMARAVGIHLVLATQRPSVDVITGVIKANLPARIALRVSSAIDSRVIVDTVGAECLLGKGDMLYLPPASSEPLRAQGAFVSEKEVENLVEHVKQFGMPEYEDLFGSGSALEFAVEDKKEMKDLIEALKLVLERKRVSQDLLKAHFGSSARATNILSLMEVKEFINKPEGSNRWEINFDQIEDFISKVNAIPEQEMSS
jgi:S-DNA-T family DNA segregation ATPase FtsK/SpoIIIE